MDHVVGDEKCGFSEICRILLASKSCESLLGKLVPLSRSLHLPADVIHKLKLNERLSIESSDEALHGILEKWRSIQGYKAKLSVFIAELEELKLLDCAEDLRNYFKIQQKQDALYVCPPNGYDEFLTSKFRVLIISSMDKNVTASKLKDTTNCVLLEGNMEFARQLSTGKWTECFAIACDEEFNLCGVHPLIVPIPKTKVIVITEDSMEKAQSICPELAHVTVVRDTLKWSTLSPLGQLGLSKNSILISGKLMTFQEVAYKRSVGGILDGILDENFLLNLVNDKRPNLVDSRVPDPIHYYVPRRLSPRNLLKPDNIFKSRKHTVDIFLFTGMERHELSRFASPHSTDTSSNQRRMSHPNVNYILLETKSDFTSIALKARAPLHWIYFKDGKFYWVKSSGKVDAIQEAVDAESAQTEFPEADFHIELQQKATGGLPVIISDTAGMGKSELLANCARELESRGEIALFGVMYDLVKGLKMLQTSGMGIDNALIQQLSTLGGSRLLAQSFLRDLLKSGDGNVKINVFLDGLDEVLTSDMDLALQILKSIKSITTARLWVATRTHLLKELENCLSSLGYKLHEFNSRDQVECLVKFWKDDQETLREPLCETRLEKFAHHCLKELALSVNSEIAGVPLQCMFIGDVFKEEARNFANPENLTTELPPTIQIESITQLFQVMIKKKLEKFFERYQRVSNKAAINFYMKDLIQAHIFFSLKLLFPEFNILRENCVLQMQDILNVGILKLLSSDGVPHFIHRLFAEFFVALFIKGIFNGETLQEEIVDADKFFGAVFATREYEPKINYLFLSIGYVKSKTYKFELNLILYFVDELIQSSSCNFCPNVNSKQFAHSFINANFSNLFECFDKMGLFEGQERSVFDSNLAILAAINSEIGLIGRICEKYEKASGFRVRDIILGNSFTILHIAVAKRPFSVVEHFVNNQGFREILEKNRKLVCELVGECVFMSSDDRDELVREKLDTLKLLLHFSDAFLLKNHISSKILLMAGVHWRFIIELVRLGADVMVLDSQQMSTLHRWCTSSPTAEHYHEQVSHIPTSSISKLLQLKETQWGFTPLHFLVDWMDPDPRTLQLFNQLGADFNSFNFNQDSVLETAVKEHRSITTLHQLILHGADWRPTEPNGWTILHVALGSLNIEAFKYFCEKMTDDPRMRENVSSIVHWDDLEKLELISEMGMNTDAKDKRGQTLLQRFINRANYGEQLPNVKLISLLERNGAITSTRLAFEVLVDITRQNYDSEESASLISRILSKWPSVLEEQDEEGNTLLHHTVRNKDNKHSFYELISRKTDVNSKNNLGETPLHLVVEAKSAKTLVKRGADLTSLDNNNLTPLHRAIQRKNASIVESLLKSKKANDVHPQILEYVLYASEFGDFSTFQVCLDFHERQKASNVVKVQPDSVSMLHAAVRNPDPQIFDHWFQNLDDMLIGQIVHTIVTSIKPEEVDTSIIEVKIKMLELVKTKSQASINSADSSGRLPLLLENIHVDLRIWLMDHVAKTRAVDTQGRNAIFYGVTQEQHPEQLPKFLEYLIRSDHEQQFRAQSSSLLLEISQRKNVEVTPDILQLFGDHGVDVNVVDKNGMSVLMHAVKSGWDAGLLTKLVEKGSDWKMTNNQHSGVLHLAAEYGNISAVKIFSSKCDVNIRDINLDTPLHIAIKALIEHHTSNVEAAYILILDGADINAKNKDGLSALNSSNNIGLLHQAATILDSDAIQLLIQKGWDVNARNKYGATPIHCAGQCDPIQEDMFYRRDINNLFMQENWLACVTLLVEEGANLYAKNNDGRNILHLALFQQDDEDSRKLLDYVIGKCEGNLMRKKDKSKRTLLHLAVLSTRIRTQTLDLLLEYNNINDTDIDGNSVLFYWIKGSNKKSYLRGNMDILKFLLEKGADVNAKNDSGQSPLHQVVMTLKPKNWQQVLELLIHYGADVFHKFNGGKNMVHLAATSGNHENFQRLHSWIIERGLEKLLKEKDGNEGSVLHNAACYLEINEELLSQLIGFNDINDVDNDGDSILYWAIQGCRTARTFQILISNGAEWKEATNKRGDTVLHFAAWWGSVEALHFFIEKGCDINARNNLGETPLHCALRGERLFHYDDDDDEEEGFSDSVHELIEVLMKVNPDLNIVDQLGKTPIVLAKEQLQLEKLAQRTVDLLSGK